MNSDKALFASTLAGLSLVCCLELACLFPNVLLSDTLALNTYVTYNIALACAAIVVALAYGAAVGFGKEGADLFVRFGLLGHGLLVCGLVVLVELSLRDGTALAVACGVLCGAGLAGATVFWVGSLTASAERRTTLAFGSLIGSVLLAVMYFLPVFVRQAGAVAFALVALGCVVLSSKSRPRHEKDADPAGAQPANTALRGSIGVNAIVVVALACFAIMTFLFGALTSLTMGTSRSPLGEVARDFAMPIAAAVFLAWTLSGRERSHAFALQVTLLTVAVLLLAAPFDVLFFATSMGYQLCCLLFYSSVIGAFCDRRRAAILLVAIGFALAHLAYVTGMYLPDFFGVDSYETFRQSTSLGVVFAYLICIAFLLVAQWGRRRNRAESDSARRKAEAPTASASPESTREPATIPIAADESAASDGQPASAPAPEDKLSAICRTIGAQRGLTERETQVFCLLARGRDVAYICDELCLTRNTVKSYSKSIYAKLDVHSKQELISLVESQRE